MRPEICDQFITECEQACQKLGGGADLYEVMKKAPQVLEKWKRYAELFQQVWNHARNREELTAFLLTIEPEPSPAELEAVLTFIRTVPYVLRNYLQSAAKSLPPSPGGRPRGLSPEQNKEVCLQIGQLYGLGVELPESQKRMARRFDVSLRTIQRAWQERAKWKSDPI